MPVKFVGVAGLPRSGSTLLCQLLGEHPDIYCEGLSSPLCNTVLAVRRFISDDDFFLSQLDTQFDTTYGHLRSAMSGFINGWYDGCGKAIVVDKNRAWLHCIEFLLHLDQNARILVPIRELGQIYGSIEAQHQKTILIDFIDHLADYDRFGRADQLFAKDKSIGAPLISIQAMFDFPQTVRERVFFIRFEDMLAQPEETMMKVFEWLGLAACPIDLERLTVSAHESDSHYRFKYLHRRQAKISPPLRHDIPPRIQKQIETVCAWYYQLFYPEKNKG